MGANHSIVLLEGDQTHRLSEVVSCFGLELTPFTDRASGLAEIWDRTNWPFKGRPRECVHKAVVLSGPWTAILDREMSMILNEAACEMCSWKLDTRIIGYFVEDVSKSAGFFLYAPHKIRAINIQNDDMVEDFGERLPEEKGIPYEQLLDDGVIRIARRFGFVDSAFANPRGRSLIIEMIDPNRKAAAQNRQAKGRPANSREDYGGESGIHVEASGFHSVNPKSKTRQPQKPPPPPKPWWKFWSGGLGFLDRKRRGNKL